MSSIKVGLEIHGYIDVPVKLFCDCPVDHHAKPNTTICPRCTGQPGSKPMAANEQAVRKALAIALLFGCSINQDVVFQRKHYSWPDMPNGYQRTLSGTYAVPLGQEGVFQGIRIQQCHLEEDPARWDPVTGKVDYNRSGYPLIEIVTHPDFTSAQQVGEWLRKLVTILSYIKAIHKKAGIKSDVNVSVSPLFERVEIKNVNSISSIVEAIESEANRQRKEIAQGNRIAQQTRSWQDGKSVLMRTKESAADYMFISDPDIPGVVVSEMLIGQIRDELPEHPDVKRERLIALGVSASDADVLSEEFALIELFETISTRVDPVLTARWLRREVVRVAHYHGIDLDELPVDAAHLSELFGLVQQGRITDTVGQKLLEKLFESPFDIEQHIKDNALEVQSDSSHLEAMCREVIGEHAQAVEDYKKGNPNSLNFLIGQVMRKTRGAAKPDVVAGLFKDIIG